MKKIKLFAVMSALLICLISCTDNVTSKNSESNSNENGTSEITKETEASNTSVSQTGDEINSAAGTTKVPDTTVQVSKKDIPELSYDFEGLVSQKYVQALTDRNYIMTYSLPDMKISQRICIDGDNVFYTFTNDGLSYDMLYKDKTQYMMCKQNYCKSNQSGTAENLVKIFSQIGYVKSGETEYDGQKCKYDEFYQTAFDSRIKLIIDQAGEFVAFDQVGTIARIDEFKTQADKSLFEIPAGYKEVDESTIQNLFADEYTSIFGDNK